MILSRSILVATPIPSPDRSVSLKHRNPLPGRTPTVGRFFEQKDSRMAEEPLPPARPRPPEHLIGVDGIANPDQFVPDRAFADWIHQNFIREGAPLENEEHFHLNDARLGVLWTNVTNTRRQRQIVGQAEIMPPQGAMGKWQKSRALQQLRGWFGDVPDFVLTFDAPFAADADDLEFCALVEHELYHCGWEPDDFGQPKFGRDGRPKFAMRGHDVEEFLGVVRRYGAVGPAAHMVEAARRAPKVARVDLAKACGTCLKVAA